MTDNNVFQKALENHLKYLKKIQETIHGSSDYCGTDHKNCCLGKWLYGQGAIDIKSFGKPAEDIFQQLFQPHEQFHIVSKTVIDALNNNKELEAKRPLTEMIFLSSKLIQLIEKLKYIAEN